MTRALALTLAGDKIRVNCICPGMVDTPMRLGFMGPGTPEEKEKTCELYLKGVPMGRMAQPDEIAYAALFLVSDEASYITGIALPIDGGFTAR